MDVGEYHRNGDEYKAIVEETYRDFDPLLLPPEYTQFVKDDLVRFLIRLARYKFVARLVAKQDSVLEVGCGSGLGTVFLGQHCQCVTGIDVKEHEIAEAIKLNRRHNVNFEVSDFFDLSEKIRFNVVAALDVIEHFDEAAGERLIAKASKLLLPGGMLIIGSPSHYSYPYQSTISQASHVKCYTQVELRRLLSRYFLRVLPFSMNDEIVHTGHPQMAWYYFMLGTGRKED